MASIQGDQTGKLSFRFLIAPLLGVKVSFFDSATIPTKEIAPQSPGMKVLLVNDYGFELGGAESYFFEVGRHLKEAGHQVLLLSSNRERGGSSPKVDRVIGHTGHLFQLDSLFHPGNFRAFRRIEDEFSPDIIHLNNINYTLSPSVLLSTRAPVVLTLHDYFGICTRDRRLLNGDVCTNSFLDQGCQGGCGSFNPCSLEHLKRAIFRRACSKVKTLIAPSTYLKTDFENSGYTNIQHLPHPYPPVKANENARAGFLFAGRLEEQKGITELVDIFSRYCARGGKHNLTIVGSGSKREDVQSEVKRCSLSERVKLIDWLSPPELQALYLTHLALIVPSKWPEVGPLVALEALSCGLPVVGRKIGAIPEVIVDRSSGLLYANDTELPEKLLELESMAEDLSKGATAQANSGMSYTKYISHLEDIYTAARGGT